LATGLGGLGLAASNNFSNSTFSTLSLAGGASTLSATAISGTPINLYGTFGTQGGMSSLNSINSCTSTTVGAGFDYLGLAAGTAGVSNSTANGSLSIGTMATTLSFRNTLLSLSFAALGNLTVGNTKFNASSVSSGQPTLSISSTNGTVL